MPRNNFGKELNNKWQNSYKTVEHGTERGIENNQNGTMRNRKKQNSDSTEHGRKIKILTLT